MEPIVVRVDADLKELIPDFLRNRRREAERLREAIDENDLAEVGRLGHSLKGVGGGFGFDGISELGRAIETAARESHAEELRRLASELDNYLERVKIVYDA